MMRKLALLLAFTLSLSAISPLLGTGHPAPQLSLSERKALLEARESVWRAWFANDRGALERLLPENLVAIAPGEDEWHNRDAVLESAAKFVAGGGRLVRLEFPRTEIQYYGNVAVLYSTYSVETETNTKKSTSSGRATEIFLRKDGRWLNTGWHLDSGK